ncbi:Hypothetical_protein [Hexamita inflata]|uniref:Hypothetical_protein n=1 Tax=Hexamita inflata TaxID=28002 RepID=A0AA86TWV4_9EUKA|nr:Hypothetical protein HINF_LOCUS17702 [Hexamita inflata]
MQIYISLTQLSFILAWSTFQAHIFAGNILHVEEEASYPFIDGNIHLILSHLGLLLFALALLLFLLGRQGYLFQNIFNVLYFLQAFNFLGVSRIGRLMSQRLQNAFKINIKLD